MVQQANHHHPCQGLRLEGVQGLLVLERPMEVTAVQILTQALHLQALQVRLAADW